MTEDIIQFQFPSRKLLLDVGWYPEEDPSGSFRLVLIRGQDWDHPLEEYETRSLPELVATLERILCSPPH